MRDAGAEIATTRAGHLHQTVVDYRDPRQLGCWWLLGALLFTLALLEAPFGAEANFWCTN